MILILTKSDLVNQTWKVELGNFKLSARDAASFADVVIYKTDFETIVLKDRSGTDAAKAFELIRRLANG